MLKKLYIVLVLIVIFQIDSLSQMEVGYYPFNVVDSAIFTSDKLTVDTDSKPNNFISISESWCQSSLLREIDRANPKIKLKDSTTLTIDLIERNPEIEFDIERMNKIHQETNSRAFVAGFTNNTNDTISFPIQDGSLIGILEAKDFNNKWNPIQFWAISGCGNSYYSRYIFPDQTLIFTVDNNFGDTPTKMRLRLHGNDTIFISNEFSGTIDPSRFEKPIDAHEKFRHILCESVFYLEEPRYGDLNDDVEIEIVEFEYEE